MKISGGRSISRVLISTALGPGGDGIFPYTLLPAYRRLLLAVKKTETTVIAKSATRWSRRGNFIPGNPLTWKYIRRISGQGMLNAYGLTNQGVEVCAGKIRESCAAGYRVVPNYYPEFAKGTETAIRETVESIRMYQDILGSEFWALELNFSCPNAREAITENINQGIACVRRVRRDYPELFLIAKISMVHPYEFAQELERLGVKAIHGVNTIPYALVFPESSYPISPLVKVGGGGVSGGPAYPAAKKYNGELRKRVNVFLIMGCGVVSLADARSYLDLGADAVSICTLALRQPGEAARVLLALNGEGCG
jgi:dihydroorotate dehydrogenase